MHDPYADLTDDEFVETARLFAVEAHKEKRYAGKNFVVHLDDVHGHLISVSRDRYLRVGAYLHDVVEDTDTTIEVVTREFGDRAGEIVAVCTDEPGPSRKKRKQLTYQRVSGSKDYGALLVKLCDRLGNVEKSFKDGPPDMFKMYQLEHPSFKWAIYRNVLPNTLIQKRIDEIISSR
jgi:(p)ppGpp synthase/HD superfamily hydrolase